MKEVKKTEFKPLVSIITPSFNSESYIENTILSVKNQRYSKIEHIIVDGGSTDKTLNLVGQYPNIRLITEPDRGMYDAINKGLRIAKGDILAYLNSDDLYYSDSVETVVSSFSKFPDTDIVYGDCCIIDSQGRKLFTHKAPHFDWDLFVKRRGLLITQPTAFWKKTVHEKYGFFNLNYKYSADYDFFMRVFSGKKVHYTGKTIALFRLQSKSLSQTRMLDMKAENQLIWKTWHKERENSQKNVLWESIKLRAVNWQLFIRKEYWQAIFTKIKIYKLLRK